MAHTADILLLTPPLVPPNAPYPATPVLTATLREAGWRARQQDLSLALLLRVFSRDGLGLLAETARQRVLAAPASIPHVAQFLALLPLYRATVEDVLAFLSGRSDHLPDPLPEGPRFHLLRDLRRSRAPCAAGADADPRLRASLYLDDLADALRDGVDDRFGFARYAERLALAAGDFTPLLRALDAPPSPIDRMIDALALEALDPAPDLVGLTVPFPGNLYAALRIARVVRSHAPRCALVLGGGYPSTELRRIEDLRIFEEVDALIFDDGEEPLLRFLEARFGDAPHPNPLRTATRQRPPAASLADPAAIAAPARRHRSRPAPVYDGLPLDCYFGVSETPNPMHRLWSERFWNKLTLAHGCYWHRCAFCDTSLDYIARYDPADARTVLRWMDAVHAQTGRTGFHFVDEAAPPALLRRVATALARRGAPYAWWTNIRLDRPFDADLARALADGGCIAVSAGLECPSDRLLRLMRKGTSLREAARILTAFAEAGILTHAYLMYGFPTQTVQETVDGLDFVRGLFLRKVLHSAYWHRFALTCHSPIAAEPDRFRIRLLPPETRFACNEIPYCEPRAPDHARLGEGLRLATAHYQLGLGLHDDVRRWFPCPVPRPRRRKEDSSDARARG